MPRTVPDVELIEFAANAILSHMAELLPYKFTYHKGETRQAIHELLEGENMNELSLEKVYLMAIDLSEDWKEYTDDDRNL